jgi:rubrerythrin
VRATPDAGMRARWEVLWIKDRRVIRKDCGDDLSEATRVYTLAIQAGKTAATLRCRNMGFPPPEKLRAREVVFDRPRLINGEKRTSVRLNPMKKRNAEGIWWCPYCCKLRKFVKRRGYYVGEVWVDDDHLCCPLCGITHRDHHVRKYNPIAATMEFRSSQRIADPQRKEKRARRRRQRREEAE